MIRAGWVSILRGYFASAVQTFVQFALHHKREVTRFVQVNTKQAPGDGNRTGAYAQREWTPMHKNNGSGPRPTYVKLTLEERRFVSTWVRENRLEGEFDSLNRLTPNQLDERVAELALINNVLWHVESTDLDTAEGISDALISNPQVVEFLRQEVAQFGYLLASGEYFSRDDERTATANRLEDKFGVDRRWLLDEPKKVAV